MGYLVSEIVNSLGATLLAGADIGDLKIERILIDSRSLVQPEGTLFAAIKTPKNDGHKYIAELYQRGVRIFLVDKSYTSVGEWKDAVFIIVDDTLEALQKLATWHRSHFKIPILAITGSNGKTIVKEWLYQLLSADKLIVRSPRSYNSQVGVPLSVWQMDDTHQLGIFEAGISQPGEMEKLEAIIKPTVGLLTNIGEAHGLNFADMSQKVKEKLKLFKDVKTLIYCKDYDVIDEAIRSSPVFSKTNLFTWSRNGKADIEIKEIRSVKEGVQILAEHKAENIHVTIPFTDEASIENAIQCMAYMVFEGYKSDVIIARIAKLQPVAMRMEMIEGMNNCSIISDVYNSDVNSLSVALDFLNQQKQHDKKTLILSDIVQSGSNEKELYARVAEIIKARKPTRLIGIGETISRFAGLFDIEKHFFNSTDEFLIHLPDIAFHNETILVKGARSFEFERISRLLQQKAHETVLQINLNALIHNLNYFRSRLKPGTRIMAMVKAFSYGSGSFEIANILQYHKTDYLAVAYADEGVQLRNSGISLPIMVMNPEPGSFDTMVRYQLEPEVYSFRVLDMVAEAVKRSGSTEPVPIHIKLDTGMHRLGFGEAELEKLSSLLSTHPQLKVQSVFSHLSASDADQHKEFTLFQISRFKEWSNKIIKKLNYPVMQHILNSAGIVRFPDAHFDMVRLGIGLYGVGAGTEEQKKLENVSTLKTTISQINKLKKGETVGYNRRGVLEHDAVIATVAIGYADGLGRELGNGKGKMWIKGKPVPIVGDVCMDMCMIDITGINVAEGDEVVIFDNIPSLIEMAKGMNTIPYEVLTGLSGRVKRIYVHE
ncbi:MAG TPA: bifunctional UDP-N-acetylmuramoyl-tripeptide:D-alanyl-D-alanine ligase/alanine racemase [Bacteroidia bacterium]|nr:bifunctional UDP-N-acetylmuramoyl-tripeptide:D-alanyl-D-alanine ligase/alanine racemase [Bacteroidia bacterium]